MSMPNTGNSGDYDTHALVDIYGNKISGTERLRLIETVAGLPATAKKDDFLHAVKNHPIVIVQGETGSGKTTQLPKQLHIADPKKRIVVTQPRVLSAMANANRVAQECLAQTGDVNFSVGRRIGYRTGRGKSSEHTSPLSFHTDGLELMRQAVSGIIPDYLVLDEVHGYTTATELLAMTARRTQERMKLIIMSATLNPEIFRNYYKNILTDIPCIEIPGRTFPVDKEMDSEDAMMERIGFEYQHGKNILLFVPGKKEIEDHIKMLRDTLGKDAQIFPLHAELPKEEQYALLKKDSSDNRPRIIVATNVAEESITIDYIDVVIDTATHKLSRYNKLGVQGLYLEDISDANCKQRAGRAGRTHPGQYFRYNTTLSSELPDYAEAPMEREMIDRHILVMLSQGISLQKLLEAEKNGVLGHEQLFFHKVNESLFEISLRRLHLLGAITRSGELTDMGHALLSFPLDVYTARMLYEGIERGCSQDMALIAAIYEKKGFVSKDTTWKELNIGNSGESDLFSYAELLKFVTSKTLSKGWIAKLIGLGVNPDELADFMDRNEKYKLYELVDLSPLGIKNKRVEEIDECFGNIMARLEGMHIDATTSNSSREKRICIATGFLHDQYTYDEEHHGFVNPKHPARHDGSPSTFRGGNVSNIEGRHGVKYIGSPFIIGTDDGGLQLLTFISVVDDGIIREASRRNSYHSQKAYVFPSNNKITRDYSHSHGSYSGGITSSAGSIPLEVISSPITPQNQPVHDIDPFEGAREHSYVELLEEYADTMFNSDEEARDYYLRYCLPEFLMSQNHSIREYIKNKLESLEQELRENSLDEQNREIRKNEWKNIFRELLARFIVSEAHRIKPGSLEKTERSFRHDTGILDRFHESGDPFIKHFRLYGTLLKIGKPRTKKESNESIYIGDEDTTENQEIFSEKSRFARLIGEGKQYRMTIDLQAIQEFVIGRFLIKASESEFPVGTQMMAYYRVSSAFHAISKWKYEDIKTLSELLKKTAGQYKKQVAPLERRTEYLQSLSEEVEKISQGKPANQEILRAANQHHAFELLDTTKHYGYHITLDRILSDDSRKRKRGKTEIGIYKKSIAQLLKNLQSEIQFHKSSIDFDVTDEVREMREGLIELSKSLFDTIYATVRIEPKIVDTVRALVRDSITEKKGLSGVLFDFFNQTHAAEHTIGVSALFQELVNHSDNMEVFDNFVKNIYPDIQASHDVEYIRKQNKKLEEHLIRMKQTYSHASRNQLFVRQGMAYPQVAPKKK